MSIGPRLRITLAPRMNDSHIECNGEPLPVRQLTITSAAGDARHRIRLEVDSRNLVEPIVLEGYLLTDPDQIAEYEAWRKAAGYDG